MEETPGTLSTAFKRTGKDAVIYGVGQGLSRAVVFLLVPLYIRYLTQSEFGKLGLLFAVQEILMPIFNLGLVAALFRSYYDYGDLKGKRLVINTVLIVMGLSTALFLFIGFFAFPFLSRAVFQDETTTVFLWIVALKALALNFQGVPLALYRARSQSVKFVILSFIFVVIKIGTILYLVMVAELGLMGTLAGDAATSLLAMVVMLWTIRADIKPIFSMKEAKKVLAFGLPLVPADLVSMVIFKADLFFLNKFTSLAVVGQYNAAVVVVHALRTMILTPLRLLKTPVVLSVSKQAFAREFYGRFMIYVLALISVAALILSLFAGEVILLVAGPGYEKAAEVLPLLLLAQVFIITQVSVGIGQLLKRKTQYIAVSLVFVALTTVVGNYFFVPAYGIMGAGYAGVISAVVLFLTTYVVSQHFYKIRYNTGRAAKLLVVLFPGYLGAVVLNACLPYGMALAARLAILVIAFLALYRWKFVEKDEMAAIKKELRSFRRDHPVGCKGVSRP